MKQYQKSNIPLAKALRKNMTPWERKLWYDYLRDYPVRFQRQKAIGDYIVDFYCAKASLVVELDGGGHYQPDQIRADAVRTSSLNSMGLRVLRICNLDIDRNFRGVCEKIDIEVGKSLPQSASLTAPSSEGALGRSGKTIYALGFFDGVHLGHQALLKKCRELADQYGCRAGAITFDTHPQTLTLGAAPALINQKADRDALLRQFSMDAPVCLPFDEQLRSMPWPQFLAMLGNEYNACGFVCGDDFRFGYQGKGNAELLAAYCETEWHPCAIVPEQMLSGVRISSTHIRGLIEDGNMEEAAAFLGHRHILSGEVVPGRQLGRTIGVPTANILLPDGVVVPRLGVYACRCQVDGATYAAVTNIGSRPTVGGHQTRAESWILDFEGDLYGRELILEFYRFLRPEQKFDSLEALRAQIQTDAEQTRQVLG